MERSKSQWLWFARRLVYLVMAAVVFACLLSVVVVRAADNTLAPAWAAPAGMTVKRISTADSTQHEPVVLNNMDCGLTGYRTPNSSAMRTGCFTPTAFGLMDADSEVVIFNGTDEGLPLLPYVPGEVLIPWPGTLGLVAFDSVSTGGSTLSLYKNPLAVMRDQRDSLGRLTAKQMTARADLSLKDSLGKQLVINTGAMAFSDDGNWLVAETLGGSFVRINLATLDMMAFAASFGSQGSPALLKSQVAISSDGRYAAIANQAAGVLKVYDLTTCGGVAVNLQPQQCAAHDYFGFARQRISGLQNVRHLRFVNDGLLSFEAHSSDPAGAGVYELAPRDSIGPLIDYLALGDSYTSGEGAFDYLAGTDTADNSCHLSANSYPLLVTRALFGSSGGHSVACSGAVIDDIGSGSSGYRGQVRDGASFGQLEETQPELLDSVMSGYWPGYVAQQRFARQYQPAVMTVSAGGNDIGFGDIVKNCVMPHVSPRAGANTCYGTYEDRLEITRLVDRTVPRWTALYKQLDAEDPGTHLYVIGYPQIALAGGDCGLNVHLSTDELGFAQELIDYLNKGIRQAAAEAGATYVDIGQALAGHRLCEAAGYDVAVNGLTAGNDAGALGVRVFGKESYHPNALGQALIEEAILERTHNLAAVPDAPSNTTGQNILDAPKTGRTVNAMVPDDALTNGVSKAGQSMAVEAGGIRDGLAVNTVYAIRLDGSGGQLIGTILSSSVGDISGRVTLPVGTSAGGHTIDVIGQNQAGEPIDVTQPVYVPAADNDSDGDGLNDSADSCPGAVNSGQDSDQDGVDDTCDRSINPALTVRQGGSAGGPGLNGSRETGYVLGSATVNPITVSAAAFRAPTASVSLEVSKSGWPLAQRQSTNWLPWMAIAVIFWLLALLGLRLNYLIGPGVVMGLVKSSFMRQKFVPKGEVFNYNRWMIWLRKGFVHLLALILLVALVGGVAALDINRNLASPSKLESWLAGSKIYDHVVPSLLQQAETSSANSDNTGAVSLSDPAVHQAAESVFSVDLVRQSVNAFINNNYDWLTGKKSAPDFKINLTSAKQDFAKQVGQATQAHLAALPVCSATQLAQLSIPVDPLLIACRPATLDPVAEGDEVAQGINSSDAFLSDPVVTPGSMAQDQLASQGQPYYKKLSWAPKLYQIELKLPWIMGGVALLSALGILFIAPTKRRGTRRIGAVVLVAGLVLIGLKLAADASVNKFANISIKGTLANQLKQPISDFMRQLEPQLVRNYMLFGVAFVVIALVIFIILFRTRHGGSSKPKTPSADDTSSDGPDPDDEGTPRMDASTINLAPRRRPATPANNLSPEPPRPATPDSSPGENPPKPKRPRLIQ